MTAAEAAPAELARRVIDEEARRQAVQAERSAGVVYDDQQLPGVGGKGLSLRAVIAAGGISTVLVLALINLIDNVERASLVVLAPDIQRSLSISDTQLGVIGGLDGLVLLPATLALGFLADRIRRTWLAGALAIMDGVFTVLTGLARSVWQFGLARTGTGLGQTGLTSVHSAILADRYPLQGRSRVFAVHNTAMPLGALVGPVAVGALATVAGGPQGWRLVYIVVGGITLLPAVAALFLREPPRGRGEQMASIGEVMVTAPDEPPIPFGLGVARLQKIRTLRFFLLGLAVLGFFLVGSDIFVNLILDRQYHLNTLQRGEVNSLLSVGDLIGVPFGGWLGDRIYRRSPPRAVILVGGSIAIAGLIATAALYMPTLPLFLVASLAAGILLALGFVPLFTYIGAVVPYRLRSLGFSLVGVYVVVFGGLAGGITAGLLSNRFGPRAALTILVPPLTVVGGALMAYGARHMRRDLSLVVEEIREEKEEQARVAAARAEDLPMLQVRHLDYSYGSVQVLFDVALEVGRGEILAVLGTNGAGKSTLLRAISGLGIPDRGVVRLGGRTVTYVEVEQRVAMGIVQVYGGSGIFPGLSVRDNLRAGARQFIGDSARVRTRTDHVLGLFPRLADRLEQTAGSLSGGEQQMLAMAKALLPDPKVLLIDELSLGLAPVVVQELLEVVERLRAEGVTMLIVEQSVNIALAIADRAIFMEKGQVRFEGPAAELQERDDLVRAVFLGAGAG